MIYFFIILINIIKVININEGYCQMIKDCCAITNVACYEW